MNIWHAIIQQANYDTIRLLFPIYAVLHRFSSIKHSSIVLCRLFSPCHAPGNMASCTSNNCLDKNRLSAYLKYCILQNVLISFANKSLAAKGELKVFDRTTVIIVCSTTTSSWFHKNVTFFEVALKVCFEAPILLHCRGLQTDNYGTIMSRLVIGAIISRVHKPSVSYLCDQKISHWSKVASVMKLLAYFIVS